MFLHVIRADYISDYRLHLWFNDSTDGEVDLAGSLDGPIFEPLKELDYFRRYQLVGNTLAWENGADFAPEYLHELLLSNTAA